jgi:hypothetical protein
MALLANVVFFFVDTPLKIHFYTILKSVFLTLQLLIHDIIRNVVFFFVEYPPEDSFLYNFKICFFNSAIAYPWHY